MTFQNRSIRIRTLLLRRVFLRIPYIPWIRSVVVPVEVEGARQVEEGRPVGDEEVGPGLAPDDAGGDGAEGGGRLGEQAVGGQQDVVLE